MIFLLLLLTMNLIHAVEDPFIQCIPPSQAFAETKLRESYKLSSVEKELKEIVSDTKNQTLREEVRALKRRLVFSKRRELPPLYTELQTKFDQMIENVETEKVITNFPMKGASAVASGAEDGTLKLAVKQLDQTELDFIPPSALKKLGKDVSVHYRYPFDSFEYFVTYEGSEVPLNKALRKILDEFEDACILRIKENQGIRATDRKFNPGRSE